MKARAAVEDALARIEALEAEIGALLDVDEDGARQLADELDREPVSRGPLHGVPFALKANLGWRGHPTGAASRILEGYRAPTTSTAIERLLAAGAIPLAITNMDEFAFGSSGENSSFGATRNPWDLSRTAGGSSSGSAAAVAAGFVPFGLGSDTGGSARQPAAFCGVSGFKPSYGRISRRGLIAFAPSLDTVGVLGDSIERIEHVLACVSGHDARDATSLALPALALEAPREHLRGLRIGVPEEWDAELCDSGLGAPIRAALDVLRELGAELVSVSLPLTQHASATYQVLSACEAASQLSRYDGVRYGARESGDGTLQDMIARTRGSSFGPEARRRILLGTALTSDDASRSYEHAARVRRRIVDELRATFEHVDLLAGATTPEVAFRLGERSGDSARMHRSDVLAVPASLAGLPAASVPCGMCAADGVELPVGLQLCAPAREDARVLSTAHCFQAATRHHLARAPLTGALP